MHINRTPVGGKVIEVTYRPGRFLAAYNERSAQENERSEIHVENEGQVIIFRQVVGVLARRVVCRIKPGMVVSRGQRFGIMKFGSRMDVFLPAASDFKIWVGDGVRGGETVVGIVASLTLVMSWLCFDGKHRSGDVLGRACCFCRVCSR